jgi:lysophospholipase L1-like esterase
VRHWRSNLLLAAGSALAFLALLEIGLRVVHPDLTVPALEVRHTGNNLVGAFTSAHFIPDRDLMWSAKPSYPPFNERGYRGEVVATPKPAGEVRILAVGDSNTLGHARSWVNELTRTLDPKAFGGQRVTVVNTAVYGYTSYQGRIRLKRFAEYQPDLVLISFGGNDATPNAVPDRLLVPSQWELFLDRAARRSRIAGLVRYLAYRRQRSAAPGGPAAATASVPRVSVDDYRANLSAMIAEARRIGARPILFTRPFAGNMYALPGNPVTPYYGATFEVGKAEKVPVVDLDRMMAYHWSLYQDHSHFNGRGHGIAAGLVARALAQIAARGSYDPAELRYHPGDPDYEELLDALHASVPLWVSFEQAGPALAASAGSRAHRTLFDSRTPGDAHWTAARPGDVIRSDGQSLCLSPPAPGSPAMTLDLPPEGAAYDFVWLELDGRVAGAVTLHWDTGAGFTDDQVTSDAFSGPFQQRPYRLGHLLPRGTKRIRLTVGSVAGGPMCFKRLWVERIAAQ